MSEYSIYIEQLGTYIINSKDVDSCRSLEYSFYENERRYKQYAIGAATFPIDVSDSDSTLSDFHVVDEYFPDSKQITVDLSDLNKKQMRKLFQLGLKEKDVHESKLREFMSGLYDYIVGKTEDETNIEILNLMMKNNSDRKISEIIKVPRQTVSYRVGTMINLAKDFVYE